MKKLTALALIVALIVLAILGADFFGIFGTREMVQSDILQLRVKPFDKATGRTVSDVHVTCARRGSEEACSQKAPSADGVLTLNFIVAKAAVYTRLLKFKKREQVFLDEEGEMVLVFIQPNYERLFLVVKTPDIVAWGDEVKAVPLEATSQVGTARSDS